MGNDLRNEITLALGGQERTMRATFTAIAAIERALGKSVVSIIEQIAGGDLSVTSAAVIVHQGLLGNDDKRLSYDQVGQAIVDDGLSSVSLPIVDFMRRSLNGVSVGKPKEETEVQPQ